MGRGVCNGRKASRPGGVNTNHGGFDDDCGGSLAGIDSLAKRVPGMLFSNFFQSLLSGDVSVDENTGFQFEEFLEHIKLAGEQKTALQAQRKTKTSDAEEDWSDAESEGNEPDKKPDVRPKKVKPSNST